MSIVVQNDSIEALSCQHTACADRAEQTVVAANRANCAEVYLAAAAVSMQDELIGAAHRHGRCRRGPNEICVHLLVVVSPVTRREQPSPTAPRAPIPPVLLRHPTSH